MSNFNGMNFAICGKSSGAVRRNVINVLKQMLLSLGYTYVDHRADNYLEVSKGNVFNLYHIFGAKVKHFSKVFFFSPRKGRIKKIMKSLI